MALALTLLSLVTLVGLTLASISGWMLAHATGGDPTFFRHITVAVPAVLFSLFTQSMILFFFIGTGKMLKEAAAKRPDPEGRAYIVEQVREMKRRTSALATFAPLSALLAGLLGAAVHTGRVLAWLHLLSAALAVALHVVAFFREVVAMAETNRLLDEAPTLTVPRPEPRA